MIVAELVPSAEQMEWAWAVFYSLTALAGWAIKEGINRLDMLKTMTRAHIAWHTVPSWCVMVGGTVLAATISQLSITGHTHTPVNMFIAAQSLWGVGLGAFLVHVMMESVTRFDRYLFKTRKDILIHKGNGVEHAKAND